MNVEQSHLRQAIQGTIAQDARIAKERRTKDRLNRLRILIDGSRTNYTKLTRANERVRASYDKYQNTKAALKKYQEGGGLSDPKAHRIELERLERAELAAKEAWEIDQGQQLNANGESRAYDEQTMQVVGDGAAEVLRSVGITDQDAVDPNATWQVPFKQLQAIAEHVSHLEWELAKQGLRRSEALKDAMDYMATRIEHQTKELVGVIQSVEQARGQANVKISAEVAKKLAA